MLSNISSSWLSFNVTSQGKWGDKQCGSRNVFSCVRFELCGNVILLLLADFRQILYIWILEHMTANIYGQVAIIRMRWWNPDWIGHTKKYNLSPFHDCNRKKTCWSDFTSTNYSKSWSECFPLASHTKLLLLGLLESQISRKQNAYYVGLHDQLCKIILNCI